MYMPGLPELIVILVIVLIFFGAGKLPEIGKALGKGIKGFKEGTREPDKLTEKPEDEEPPTKKPE